MKIRDTADALVGAGVRVVCAAATARAGRNVDGEPGGKRRAIARGVIGLDLRSRPATPTGPPKRAVMMSLRAALLAHIDAGSGRRCRPAESIA